MLSKSLYLSGNQCLRYQWWRVHEPRAVELQPSIVLEDRFDQGRQVGELARERFAGGVLIDPQQDAAHRVADTNAALASGAAVIFEATFEADGVRVSCDVVERGPQGEIALIEVKSASQCKPEHVTDCAIQAHVLAANGMPPKTVAVLHLNREFTHPSTGDRFETTDVTDAVRGELPLVPGRIEEQVRALNGPLPEVAIGAHCTDPWTCPFLGRCWPDDPMHISRLHGVGPKGVAAFLHVGVHRIDDLPPSFKLQATQRRQIRALAQDRMVVEPGLEAALEPFDVPTLGFLDFETVVRAVPVWNRMGPWHQAAAQFSYHERRGDGSVRHEEYLADGPQDARPHIAHRLVQATRGAVRVVTYTSFEKTQIRSLARMVPEYADELLALEDKLIDLFPVVRDHVYHPRFLGSYSIKAVLNPLVPTLTYHDLVIVDGLVASVEIARLLFAAGRIADDERPRVRGDLLAYCERDTWAMVQLLDSLRTIAAAPA